MPDVPVICNNCGKIFGAGFSSVNIENTQFGNTKVGPCPVCGGTGLISEGIYSFVGEAVNIVATSARSVKEIQELISRLNNVVDRELEPDEFREALLNEVPELQKVRDILPRTRSELYAFSAILLTAMGMLATAAAWVADDRRSIDKENIKQIVEWAVEENITNLKK